jgi:glyoxylase-like metal-dependent hydrolase (beta-lactamase superfamily II)
MKNKWLLSMLALWILASVAVPASALEPVSGVQLYVMDCGVMSVRDMSLFSDTGKYDGKAGGIVDTCFLIRHPKGNLLWDTGLGDGLVGHDVPPNADGVGIHVERGLLDQLAQIGITPADVTYLAFSHFHLDHTGNANEFPASTWIINQTELDWALGNPTPPIVKLDTFNAYRSAHTIMINGDYDVFGDGLVRILKTPGHTPGHQVLLIRLPKAGAVVLSGDLYHLRTDRPSGPGGSGQIMTFNTSRAETMASMDRVEGIIRNLHARLIVQHDPEDYRHLPKSPSYLE